MDTARSLGARIAAIRRRRGLTQAQLAARIDRLPDAVESPRQAALLGDMLDGARRLTSRDLQFTARIVRLIVEHHGRRGAA